jgi:N-acetylglutamate synthase-like GNAT family acetyltransferase
MWTRGDVCLYDEREKVDVEAVHALLHTTYWAKDRSLQTVRDTVQRCLCFSLYDRDGQIGFTRVISDCATYAIILDVVIQDRYRGQGLGEWMMGCITNHPDIAPLKQVLWTATADSLYQKVGFSVPANVRFMTKTGRPTTT